MNRKLILLLTNWYPTKDNPMHGSFFREQALALKEHFDFYIVRYGFGCNLIRGFSSAEFIGEEENIREYRVSLVTRTIRGRLACLKEEAAYVRDPKFQNELISLFQKTFPRKIDLLYSISGQSEAGYLMVLSKGLQVPYVVGEHGIVPWLGTQVYKTSIEGITGADLFLAISWDKVRQVMMQKIILPKVLYVGNMVDDTRFCYRPSSNSIKTFVFVGANNFIKNYDMLIAVMNRLVDITDVPFKLLIVGYNSTKDYCQSPETLETKINASKFATFTELIPFASREDMPSIYNRADAFVMTSIQEGQPVSALEASCSGLPVFSTRCGGVEDYVDESIGRIYDILDDISFAYGLKDYLEGRIFFDNAVIRDKIVSLFGKEAFTEKITEAFFRVIESYHNEQSVDKK